MSLYQSLWQVLQTVLTWHSLWRIVGVFCDMVFLSRIKFVISAAANISLDVYQQRWEGKLLQLLSWLQEGWQYDSNL